MYLGLSALAVAVAVCLAAPGLVAALRAWASLLRESRRTTVEQDLPEAFLFIDSSRYALLLTGFVIAVSAAVTIAARNGVVGSVAGAIALLLPAAATRRWRLRRRHLLLRQLPDCLELLAASLRSGLALLPAIGHLAQHQPAPIGQELTLEELQHDERLAGVFADVVDRADVRVVEGRGGSRLARKSFERVALLVGARQQDLDRDFSPEAGVPGAVNLAHSARADRGEDLVRTEPRARREGHSGARL